MAVILKGLAAKLTIHIEIGATKNVEIFWKDSAGVPIDMTGYEARMQIRDPVTHLIDELTTLNSRILIDIPTGKITLTFPADVSTALYKNDCYDYDLEVYIPGVGGDVRRLIEGEVVGIREVTV